MPTRVSRKTVWNGSVTQSLVASAFNQMNLTFPFPGAAAIPLNRDYEIEVTRCWAEIFDSGASGSVQLLTLAMYVVLLNASNATLIAIPIGNIPALSGGSALGSGAFVPVKTLQVGQGQLMLNDHVDLHLISGMPIATGFATQFYFYATAMVGSTAGAADNCQLQAGAITATGPGENRPG